jgi:hypothetical protein
MRLIALVFLLLASQVQATTFCVSTGNELQTALDTAGGNGLDDEIRIVSGTHTSNANSPETAQWDFIASYTDDTTHHIISGGWSSANNCASQTTQNPAATVLDAQYFGSAFHVELFHYPSSGSFSLSNLTLVRGKAFLTNVASGLNLSASLTGPGSITLNNLLITSGLSAAGSTNALDVFVQGAGSFRLRNSVIKNNSHTSTTSGTVMIQTLDSVAAYISNNSIFDNSATRKDAGLMVTGIATLSNNAVADNVSTANPYYQFYSDLAYNLTLRNNHFATYGYLGTPYFSNINTTIGNPFWTLAGEVKVPDIVSPLRDSGLNTPTGGALAIDFLGNPRILNVTMDRGAVEAAVPPPQGPQVTPNTPASGSTTVLVGDSGGPAFGYITFNVSGGFVPGSTDINCQATAGSILIGAFPSQTIGVGQSAQPVLVGFNSTVTAQSGVIFCSIVRTGFVTNFHSYTFKAEPEVLFKSGFE